MIAWSTTTSTRLIWHENFLAAAVRVPRGGRTLPPHECVRAVKPSALSVWKWSTYLNELNVVVKWLRRRVVQLHESIRLGSLIWLYLWRLFPAPVGGRPTVLHNHSTQLSVAINTTQRVWIAQKIGNNWQFIVCVALVYEVNSTKTFKVRKLRKFSRKLR